MKYNTQKAWIIGSAACIVSATAFAIEPAAVEIGELNLFPTINIKTSHNNNILATETNEKKSWITRINPNLVLQGERENTRFDLSYGLEKGVFHSSSADDYLDHNLNGLLSIIGNSRNRIDLNAGYSKGHEARGQESGGTQSNQANPLEYNLATVEGIYTYGGRNAKGRIELQANYSDKDYTNFASVTDIKDYSQAGAGATFYYRMTGKTSALVEVNQNSIDYDTSNKDSKTTKALVGVTWDATAKTTGKIKVGWADKDFDDASLTDTDGVTWDGVVTWNPKSYSTFTFNFGQDYAESTSSDSYIDTDSYGLDWGHFWNDKLKSTIAFNSTIEDYSNSSRKDTTKTVTIGLNHDTKRWLNLGIGYILIDKDSNLTGSSYKSNEITFTLQASL
jgi:hypothetical protein